MTDYTATTWDDDVQVDVDYETVVATFSVSFTLFVLSVFSPVIIYILNIKFIICQTLPFLVHLLKK